MVQGRCFRPKPAELKGTDYDSRLEKRMHEALPQLEFHPEKVEYVRHHTYEPDFQFDTVEGRFLIEAKGYYQDRNELGKYPAIKACLPAGTQIVFVFENPDKPIHFQAKRKDGSKMSHREWCIKNDFLVFGEEEFTAWMQNVTCVEL